MNKFNLLQCSKHKCSVYPSANGELFCRKCHEESIALEKILGDAFGFDSAEDSGTRKEFESGALRDRPGGKGMYVLLSPVGLRRIALRCEQGHKKYGDGRNWEKGMPVSEFIDSAMRHIGQYLEGDTTEDHLAAAAWNLQAAMHTEEKMPQMQDIPARLAAKE